MVKRIKKRLGKSVVYKMGKKNARAKKRGRKNKKVRGKRSRERLKN